MRGVSSKDERVGVRERKGLGIRRGRRCEFERRKANRIDCVSKRKQRRFGFSFCIKRGRRMQIACVEEEGRPVDGEQIRRRVRYRSHARRGDWESFARRPN